jgi:hypothetical protein
MSSEQVATIKNSHLNLLPEYYHVTITEFLEIAGHYITNTHPKIRRFQIFEEKIQANSR